MEVQIQAEQPFPLFKGVTRVATVAGVPMMAFIGMLIVVAALALVLSLWFWLLAIPTWFIMAQITKNDDQAFRIWGLWFDTKWRNSNKKFWGASTYSKRDYRKKNRR